MKTFKQFIVENSNVAFDIGQLVQLAQLVRSQCKPFLDEAGGPMYRGIKRKDYGTGDAHTLAIKSPHPEYRAPKDSPTWFNYLFNLSFENNTGVKDVRTKSVFITGLYHTARTYGEAHLVFPIGDIQYAFWPGIPDSYEDRNVFWKHVADELGDAVPNLISLADYPLKPEHFVEGRGPFGFLRSPFIMHRLIGLMAETGAFDNWAEHPLTDAQGEIVAKQIQKLYWVDGNYDDELKMHHADMQKQCMVKWWRTISKIILQAYTAKYAISKDLDAARRRHDEVMVFSSDGYYAIDCDILAAAIATHFTKQPDEDGNTGELHSDYMRYRTMSEFEKYKLFLRLGER